jgi:hypothetical protein
MESSEGAHWYLQCFVKDIGEIKGKRYWDNEMAA